MLQLSIRFVDLARRRDKIVLNLQDRNTIAQVSYHSTTIIATKRFFLLNFTENFCSRYYSSTATEIIGYENIKKPHKEVKHDSIETLVSKFIPMNSKKFEFRDFDSIIRFVIKK